MSKALCKSSFLFMATTVGMRQAFFKVNLELHKESGNATLKNLILVADRINSTRII